ncbi:MAG: VanZ family protein [Candidatus Omnitrophota bacterium]
MSEFNLKLEIIRVFIGRWSLFFIYCAFIYISLPFAPKFWEVILKAFGEGARDFPYLVGFLIFINIIFMFLLLKKRKPFKGLLLICLVFFAGFIIMRNLEFLAERMHLLEYIILPFIIFKSINRQQSKESMHFKILLIGFIVGAIDEIIQRFIPGRVFDIKDIFLNAASVSLGQVLLYTLKHLS